jgi:hypothetical protein
MPCTEDGRVKFTMLRFGGMRDSRMEKTVRNGLKNVIGSLIGKPVTGWTFFCHIFVAEYKLVRYVLLRSMMVIKTGM